MNHKEKRRLIINLLGIIILAGFILAVFFHYIMGAYFGLDYPSNSFVFAPQAQFGDFSNSYRPNIGLNPYLTKVWIKSNYYPFANILIYFFTLIPLPLSFLLFMAMFVASMVWLNKTYLRLDNKYEYLANVFVFSFLTYPFLFLIDRGNFEGLVFIFLCLFFYFYCKDKFILSAVFLSFAIAMKIFPAVLLVLFLVKKRYKEAIYVVILVILLTIVSLLVFQGGFFANLAVVLRGFDFNANYAYWFAGNNFVQRGVTLFTLAKIIFNAANLIDGVNMSKFLAVYNVAALFSFVFLAAYVVLVEEQFWKQVAVLILSMLLFPYVSADYKLIYVFFPLLLFINAKERSREDWFYLPLFALLLIPKSYYILPNMVSDGGRDISIAVPLNILILLVILSGIVITGLRRLLKEKRFGGVKDKFFEQLGLFRKNMVFLVILACFFIFVFFYAKSINAQHRDFQNYYDQSRRAYVAKDYLGCIGAARKGLQFKPANADAYNMISMAYLGLRAWDKAEDAAQRALKLAPDFEAARRNLYFAKTGEKLELGKVFFKRGKYAEAIKLCNDVLRINPGSVNAYIVLSRVYRAWGNKKGAEEAAEKALEIASRSQRVYANFDFVRDALGWDK